MQAGRLSVFCATLAFAAHPVEAQGLFQNLDFESATLIPIQGDPFGSVEFDPAFPGWTGNVGGVQETSALYNNEFLDSSGIGIHDHSSSYTPVIQGDFTAVLQAGRRLDSAQLADTTLLQTGLIPPDTKSLLFQARSSFGGSAGPFSVSLGGQNLSLILLQTSATYTLYGADVEALAGRTAQLSFTVLAQQPHENNLYLDSIQFSPQPIPEPEIFTFGALGMLLFSLHHWRFRLKV